jgi:HEAT repeat protein
VRAAAGSSPALAPGDLAARRELERRIAADPDPSSRREAIDSYATPSAEADPLLDSVFGEPDPLVRRWAAMALAREARPQQIPALRQAIPAERDPAVKRILQQALRAAELR